uniref:hypothetical protein n=1 Tax=Lentilactobacillus buchneri TaxID=1581 RepID=UPI0038B3AAFF
RIRLRQEIGMTSLTVKVSPIETQDNGAAQCFCESNGGLPPTIANNLVIIDNPTIAACLGGVV